LMHDSLDTQLTEEGNTATWHFRVPCVEKTTPPAANDFIMPLAAILARRYTGTDKAALAVRFVHEEPTDADGYARIIRSPIAYGAPMNAAVLPREWLDTPMIAAQPAMRAAFELQAAAALEKLRGQSGIAGRVRALIAEQLQTGDIDMRSIG